MKEALDFGAQVKQLQNHKIIIENEEFAEAILKRINYYRLLGYFLPFKDKYSDTYPKIVFENVIKIYEFDAEMRTLLFELIEKIEEPIRTQISNYHGIKRGALGYYSPEWFERGDWHCEFLGEIARTVKRNSDKKSPHPVFKHHNEKYGGRYPIWVIADFLTLGTLSRFYSNMIIADRKRIACKLGYGETQLKSWLRCLTDLRNQCAHYSRLYYWTFSSIPASPSHIGARWGDLAEQRLFVQIMMLKFMYLDKDKWDSTIATRVICLIENYSPYIKLEHLGFPENWKALLLNKEVA